MSRIVKNYGYIGPTTPNKRYDTTEGQLMNGFPIGILQLYAHLPFFPGNVSNAYTYDFPVKFIHVEGTDIPNILAGDMSLVEPIVKAAKQLEMDGCRAICANCGYFGHFQSAVADQLDVPVYLSSLIQASWALTGLKKDQKLGVMCANSGNLNSHMFESCGVTPEMQKRIVVAGAQDKEEFSHILEGKGGLDSAKLGEELCDIARNLVKDNPDIGALLLECTDMPPYSYLIQAELGLPVFDAITLINYVKTTVTQTPYYGFL